jgi:hypothetical protein
MADLLLLAADMAITFGIGAASAYAFGQVRAMFHEVKPYVGCRVRIRGKSQIYRCRLESVRGNRWTLGPPLVRDEFYPLVKGEKITAEVVLDSGTLLFRSEVAFSDDYKGRIWIKTPRRTFWKQYGHFNLQPSTRSETTSLPSTAWL